LLVSSIPGREINPSPDKLQFPRSKSLIPQQSDAGEDEFIDTFASVSAIAPNNVFIAELLILLADK